MIAWIAAGFLGAAVACVGLFALGLVGWDWWRKRHPQRLGPRRPAEFVVRSVPNGE